MGSGAEAGKEVLVYKNEKCASSNGDGKKIHLDDIENISIINQSQDKHMIELVFQSKEVKRFLFSSELEAKEWHKQLNVVCFDSILEKEFKDVIEGDMADATCPEESNEAGI